jgi:hypothetical protein
MDLSIILANAVLMDIRERNRRKSWKYVMERRKDRQVYVDLYKRKQKAKWVRKSVCSI